MRMDLFFFRDRAASVNLGLEVEGLLPLLLPQPHQLLLLLLHDSRCCRCCRRLSKAASQSATQREEDKKQQKTKLNSEAFFSFASSFREEKIPQFFLLLNEGEGKTNDCHKNHPHPSLSSHFSRSSYLTSFSRLVDFHSMFVHSL